MQKTITNMRDEYKFAKEAISLKLFYSDRIPMDKIKKHFTKIKKFSDQFMEMMNNEE